MIENNVNRIGAIGNNKNDTIGNVKQSGLGRKQLVIIKMNVTGWGNNEKS